MFDMMIDMQKDMGQTKLMAQTAVQTAEMALTSLTQIKSSVQSLQTKDSELEQEIGKIKDQLSRSSADKTHKDKETLGTPELQVIVEGLKEPQDENDIIEQVKNVLDGLGVSKKYDNIGTFVDPSKIGVIQFKSIASKIGFLRRISTIETKWTNGSNMHFKSNDTIEKRKADKTLGFIKYHLHETKRLPLSNIAIKWKKNTVEVNGNEVARVSDTGEVTYESDYMDMKTAVDRSISEWKDKRRLE